MTIDPNHDFARCGGPRGGCLYCLHILNAEPAWNVRRLQAEDRVRSLRAASFRAGIHYEETDMTPPNPYARDLAALQAANREQTPLEAFQIRHAEERRRELNIQRAAIDARIAEAPTPRMTAAEAAEFTPPNPWTLR